MSAIPASIHTSPSRWRTALPAVVLLQLLILFSYRETAAAMVGVWMRSDTFAHAFLVLPISLWLVWRQRLRLAELTPRPQPWFLLPLLAVALVWLASEALLVNAPAQFALVGMLVLAVPAVLGLQITGVILFPLLFLFVAVPFGEFMVPSMMEWTADFVVWALRLTGVPVYREGLQFVIPSGNWSVVTECSGVRYLMASFMVGSLFAYLNYSSYKKRVAFMLASLLMPILANWLRAYIIVMLGHLSGNKLAAGVDHILYGWVFFGIVIFVMFMVGARWADADPQGNLNTSPRPAPAEAGRLLPLMAVVTAMVAVLPQAVLWGLQRADNAAAPVSLELPSTLAPGWTREPPMETGWEPVWFEPSASVHQAYAGPGGAVGVHVFYYRHQDAEHKLVSSLNRIVGINDRAWQLRTSRAVEVAQVAGGPAVFQAASIQLPSTTGGFSARSHIAAWQIYWIDGRWVAGELPTKLANASARFRGRGDDGASLVVYAVGPTSEASHAAVKAFIDSNLDQLNKQLQQTRDRR